MVLDLTVVEGRDKPFNEEDVVPRMLYRNVPTSGSFELDVGTFLLKTFSKHLKTN